MNPKGTAIAKIFPILLNVNLVLFVETPTL
jgi:hypothetical protein